MKTLQRIVAAFLISSAVWISVYFWYVRPLHMRWGATADEIALGLPGDFFYPPNANTSTRAITIHAPPSVVWQWLVQMGQRRGGFYSYTWLENLFAADMHNADRIQPEYQTLNRGDRLSLQEKGPTVTVTLLYPDQALCFGGWTFALIPVGAETTRLIVRYPSTDVETGRMNRWLYYGIFEPAHFVMESGEMLGVKARAEGRIGQ
ncbi:MAG: hypothetical protein WB699_04200 [Bacteroidota bacterium]